MTTIRITTTTDDIPFAAAIAGTLGDAEVDILSDGFEVVGNADTVRAVAVAARIAFPNAIITEA